MDSYDIPWAPVWGNHDNEDGAKIADKIEDLYLSCQSCIYEKGNPELGHGNYLITIKQENKTVEGIFMMDTHSTNDITVFDRYCVPRILDSWGTLSSDQLEWYKKETEQLKQIGCNDSTLIIHIPFYGYREAFFEATEREARDVGKISLCDSYK